MLSLFVYLGILLALPIVFVGYRKIEFALRVSRSKSYGDCTVQKPILIGVLQRWVKKQPLDVSFYHQLFLRHGRTFTTHPFMKPLVMTAHPENVKTILATKHGQFDIGHIREDLGQVYMRKGIFTTQASDWHSSRAFVRPAFNKMNYMGLEYLERHFQRLLQNIPADGLAFDLQPLLFAYTLNTISEMLFGVCVEDLGYDDADMQKFHEAEKCMRVKGLRAVHLSTLSNTAARLYRSSELIKSAKVFHQFVADMVSKSVERYQFLEKGARYSLLHDSMERTGDVQRARDEATNLLFAGRDTGAVLMSNVFFTLSRRPDLWTKLRAEVSQLNGNLPSYEDLKNMRYLNNIIKEANRLFPVVPFNYREALVDTTIPMGGGPNGTTPLFVAKGTYVMYCTYAMHRDTSVYGANALDFNPDRWDDPQLRPGWAYVPFNGGPRTCIGQNMAQTEMSYTIVRMLQNFDGIRSEDSAPFKPSTNFVMANVNGAKMSLYRKKLEL
ncbi:cytochrome P450 [Polyplosphaeria fusca]|uniref:Cytochrome P450 n=1 Tax=Polyplosphaeria fusca TaxID=682080 RepID=A0A9P4R0A5_9PLEO|nr:cytochrome P450 [Polyplosphaeria fusca]